MSTREELEAMMNGPIVGLKGQSRGNTKPNGYAATPGLGPKGETCGSCKYIEHVYMSKTYLKCGKARSRQTHGKGTDILARSPACVFWEKPDAP